MDVDTDASCRIKYSNVAEHNGRTDAGKKMELFFDFLNGDTNQISGLKTVTLGDVNVKPETKRVALVFDDLLTL